MGKQLWKIAYVCSGIYITFQADQMTIYRAKITLFIGMVFEYTSKIRIKWGIGLAAWYIG